MVERKLGTRHSSWHKGKVIHEKWEDASYGIKRLRGMIKFAKSEDWTRRLP